MSKSTSYQGGEITEKISNFDEGITSNLHNSRGVAEIAHGHVYPDRVIPRRGLIEDTTTGSHEPKSFVVRPRFSASDTQDEIWGLDFNSEAIVSKETITTGSWSPAVSLTETPVDNTPVVWYKGKMHWMGNSSRLQRVSTNSSPVLEENVLSGFTPMTGTFPFAFVLHPDYDKVYVLEKSSVSEINNSTINKDVLLLNEYKTLTCGTHYNQFLAMGQFDEANQTSDMLIWNVNLENPYIETIPWGDGELVGLGNVRGYLVGMTLEQGDSAGEMTRLVFQRYNGSTVEFLNEMVFDDIIFADASDAIQVQSDGQKMYFKGLSKKKGNSRINNSIFSIDELGRIIEEFTVQDASNNVFGFVKKNNQLLVSHSVPFKIHYSDSADTYDYDTKVTSLIIDGNLPEVEKTLKSITVPHSKLKAGQSIKVEYLKPGDTNWVEIGTKSEEDSYRSTFTRMYTESSINLPSFNTILIRVISNGGAVIKPFEVVSVIKESDKK